MFFTLFFFASDVSAEEKKEKQKLKITPPVKLPDPKEGVCTAWYIWNF